MRQSYCSRVLASWPQILRRTCTHGLCSGMPRTVQPARPSSGARAVAKTTEGKVEMTLTNASVNGSVRLHAMPVNDRLLARSRASVNVGSKPCELLTPSSVPQKRALADLFFLY